MDMPYSMESGNASDHLKTKEKQDQIHSLNVCKSALYKELTQMISSNCYKWIKRPMRNLVRNTKM